VAGVRPRAVVFDLWQTLVPYDSAASEAISRRMAAHVGADPDSFVRAWIADRPRRDTGPLADSVRAVCREVGLDRVDVEMLVDVRREATLAALVPRDGALETLAGLRARGLRVGLITNSAGDVPDVWPRSPLSRYVEVAVFSCSVGAAKPDARLYETACAALALDPAECLFVDDFAPFAEGARAVGLSAALIAPALGPEPAENARWTGPRLSSLQEVLGLVD
jgi:putative hydrolase of the HAD superfamily